MTGTTHRYAFALLQIRCHCPGSLLLGSGSERGGECRSQRHVVRPWRLFHDDEVDDLQDDQLIEEEPADGGHHEQAEPDQRGGQIADSDDLTAYDAGHTDRRKPTEMRSVVYVQQPVVHACRAAKCTGNGCALYVLAKAVLIFFKNIFYPVCIGLAVLGGGGEILLKHAESKIEFSRFQRFWPGTLWNAERYAVAVVNIF